MAEVKTFVDGVIANNRIAVFSKSWCPYCASAKQLLRDQYKDVPTEVVEINERDDGSAIQEYLREKTGQGTVPNIFIDTNHIGGNSDLQALKGPKLDALINTPSAL